MKYLSFLFSFLLFVLFSGCQEQNLTQATVQKDCTGTYIRWNNQDFHVCNTEKTDNIASGTTVKVSFNTIKNCNGTASQAIVCMMLHENAGWIEIKQIN